MPFRPLTGLVPVAPVALDWGTTRQMPPLLAAPSQPVFANQLKWRKTSIPAS